MLTPRLGPAALVVAGAALLVGCGDGSDDRKATTAGTKKATNGKALPKPKIGKARLIGDAPGSQRKAIEVPVAYSGPKPKRDRPDARRTFVRATISVPGRSGDAVRASTSESVGAANTRVMHYIRLTPVQSRALDARGPSPPRIAITARHSLTGGGGAATADTTQPLGAEAPAATLARQARLGGDSGGGTNPCSQDGAPKQCQNVGGEIANAPKGPLPKGKITATCPSGTTVVTEFNAATNHLDPYFGIDTNSPHWTDYSTNANDSQVWTTVVGHDLTGYPYYWRIYAACTPD